VPAPADDGAPNLARELAQVSVPAAPAPPEQPAVHPAIARILAVGGSVSAAPGEGRVTMAVPSIAEAGPLAEAAQPAEGTPASADTVTTAMAAPMPEDPGPRPEPPATSPDPIQAAQWAEGLEPARPAEPTQLADAGPRWRSLAPTQLADSDAARAISAILGRPDAG